MINSILYKHSCKDCKSESEVQCSSVMTRASIGAMVTVALMALLRMVVADKKFANGAEVWE